jgi:Tfp pilus assembly protein PilF
MHHRRNVMTPASLPTQMLVKLGHAYLTLRDTDRAIDHFSKAVEDARSGYSRDRSYTAPLWKALSGLGHAQIITGDNQVDY